MKKTFIVIISIIIFGALMFGGYYGYKTYLAPPTSTAVISSEKETRIQPRIVSSEGKVKPQKWAQLSFKSITSTSGMVESLYFNQGQIVKSGQVIARLSGKEKIEAGITSAQLEILSAQQKINDLYQNNELAKANAQKAVADAKDNQFKSESQVNYLKSKVSQSQLDAAEAALTLATSALDRSRERVNELNSSGKDDELFAAAVLVSYGNEKIYNLALANVNYLRGLGRSDSRDLQKAEANLAVATAQLNIAKLDYETYSKGPDPDLLELAQSRLANGKAQLASAQAALRDLDLIAPFDGTLVQLNLKLGEITAPSLPAVILADLRTWKIETTDLTEKDVAFLAIGMPAVIRLDAFPGLDFDGIIREIDLLGVVKRGAANYTISIDFDPKNVPVRWEMTAFVDFTIPEIK